MALVTARSSRVRQLRTLAHRRSERRAADVAVLEGPHPIEGALAAGVVPCQLFVEDERADAVELDLADRAAAAGTEVIHCASGALDRAVTTTTPQAIAAICAWPGRELDDVLAGGDVLVLDEVSDPGNVGTILRSAAATGLGVVALTGCADAAAPKTVRASAGSVFQVPVAVDVAVPALVAAAVRSGHRLVGSAPGQGQPYHDRWPPEPVALVVGNEARGLRPELAANVDQWVHIPMATSVESLNAAMSAAVLAFELRRQRVSA